jgi:hypothetical protein
MQILDLDSGRGWDLATKLISRRAIVGPALCGHRAVPPVFPHGWERRVQAIQIKCMYQNPPLFVVHC